MVRTDDPAFQPPSDPLADIAGARAGARVITRQIPLTTIQTNWTVAQVRAALDEMVQGQFNASSQLVDACVGDDRVQATLGSRRGGLFGRDVVHEPANDSREAREVCDAWAADWPRIGPEPTLKELSTWTVMQGWYGAPITWDTSGERWIPKIQPWHPSFTFYLPNLFQYIACTQDGLQVMTEGTGRWFMHTPNGAYRGWMSGAVRAVAQPWLIRNFAYRDWARYSERHGMPMIRAYVPAAGDPQQRERFVASVSNIGQETAIMLPQGVDETFSYDVDVLEASDQSWQAFPGLIDRCDMSIVLAILFQNLTTEVKEGSFAAARVHGDVRQGALATDNNAYKASIRTNLGRPYAAFNYGDPELAPYTCWEVQPVEDREGTSRVFASFCNAVKMLSDAGWKFRDPDQLRLFAWNQFALKLGKLALEKAEAVAAGKATVDEATSEVKKDPKELAAMKHAIESGAVTPAKLRGSTTSRRKK